MDMNHTVAPVVPRPPQPQAQAPVSAEDQALFDQIFSVTDEDGSGDVNLQEFGDLLEYARQQSGTGGAPLSGNAVNSVLNEFDINSDGALSKGEFDQFLQSSMLAGTSAESGQVSGETRRGPASVHQCGQAGEQTEMEALFAEYDAGYGANVDSQNKMIEFRNWLQHTKGMDFEQANSMMLNMTEVKNATAGALAAGGTYQATPFVPVAPVSQESQADHSEHQV